MRIKSTKLTLIAALLFTESILVSADIAAEQIRSEKSEGQKKTNVIQSVDQKQKITASPAEFNQTFHEEIKPVRTPVSLDAEGMICPREIVNLITEAESRKNANRECLKKICDPETNF